MPYTDKQVKAFLAAAHNPKIAKRMGMSTHQARKMAMEAGSRQRSRAMKAKSTKTHQPAYRNVMD